MDNIQDLLALIPLPNSILAHLTTHSATYLSLYQRLSSLQSYLRSTTLNHLVYPFLLRLYNSPDVLTLLLLGILLLVSFKVLGMLRRAVMFWVRMFTRLVFWGSVLVAGVYVWGRGWEGAVDDVSTYGGEVARVWMREYRRFEDAQKNGAVGAGMDRRAGRGYRGR